MKDHLSPEENFEKESKLNPSTEDEDSISLDEEFDLGEDFIGKKDSAAFEATYEDLFEFEVFDDSGEEFDTSDEREELSDVLSEGRLTRAEKAYQVALQVGLSYGLSADEIDLLQEIFYENGWSQARLAIERELSEGTTAEELRLAKDLKELWDSHDDWTLTFRKRYGDKSEAAYSGDRILSWVIALEVIRLFPEGIDVLEIEYLLESTFESWVSSRKKRMLCRSFLRYLKFLVSVKDHVFWINDFQEDEYLNLEDETENWRIGTPIYSELTRMGLIPDIWLDFLDRNLGAPDPKVMNDY